MSEIYLGVNIDHIATLRHARGTRRQGAAGVGEGGTVVGGCTQLDIADWERV